MAQTRINLIRKVVIIIIIIKLNKTKMEILSLLPISNNLFSKKKNNCHKMVIKIKNKWIIEIIF